MNKEKIVKSRYWEAIFYPENCLEHWKALLPDLIQLPCCYCVHDKDVIGEQYNLLERRKIHVHIILVFDGPTTQKKVIEVVNRLSKPGAVCCPVCLPILSVKACYNYLVHNTESAINAGKYRYSDKERICCNNFDIGLYVQIASALKEQARKELAHIVLTKKFTNFRDFYVYVLSMDEDFESDVDLYQEVVASYSGFFERLIKGNYYHFCVE